FLRIAMRQVNRVDGMTFMLDEAQPLFEGPIVCTHASNDPTTAYAPSSAASSAEASFPPASARSGRPPPFPPTFCATGPITLPACTRPVRSLVTPTISATFPFDADPRITTPDPILSRN